MTAATIARLSDGRRIWALGALRGDDRAADTLARSLIQRWQPTDRLVVLGNMLGPRGDAASTIDRLLRLRRRLMAVNLACDVVFLRGAQEEMWHKALALQFALEPLSVLDWMLAQGLAGTLAAYGASLDDGRAACRSGPLAIARWTSGLRALQAARPGHAVLMNALARAARSADGGVLLTAAGMDAARPLQEQRDAFWWNGLRDAALDAAMSCAAVADWQDLSRLVRGCGPRHDAPNPLGVGRVLTVSHDRPALVAIGPQGNLLDRLEA
ncbi:MAG: hypothetical protein ACOY4R_23475 [Pseudomonadota bacterium]